jgi:hypothetical protein
LINKVGVGVVHLKLRMNFRLVIKFKLRSSWKTPGLYTYVSSKPSKIGCKAKYFVLLPG